MTSYLVEGHSTLWVYTASQIQQTNLELVIYRDKEKDFRSYRKQASNLLYLDDISSWIFHEFLFTYIYDRVLTDMFKLLKLIFVLFRKSLVNNERIVSTYNKDIVCLEFNHVFYK